MKITHLFFILLALILLTSCNWNESTNPPDYSGILRIYNNTNADIIVDIAVIGATDRIIDANSSRDFSVDTGKGTTGSKSTSVTITSEGIYKRLGNDTVIVYTDDVTELDIDADCGILRITNNTNGPISVYWDSTPYNIDANQSDTYTFDMPSVNNDNTTYTIDGQYVFEFDETTTITRNETFNYTVFADAGCFAVDNASGYTITEIYISLSTSSIWGSDDLNTDLYPDDYVIFTLNPDLYDFKIVDSDGFATILYDVQISTDQTFTYNYYGKKNGQPDHKTAMDDISKVIVWEQK
jgi:hypothetical protein